MTRQRGLRGSSRSRTAARRRARRSGVQRPRIMAASAMNPLPPDISLPNAPDVADGEERAAEAGDRRRQQDVAPPGAVDLDADGVGGLGVLADGPHAQSPAGAEQGDVQHDHGDVHGVDEDGLVGTARARAPGSRTARGSRSACSSGGVFSVAAFGLSTAANRKLVRPMASTLSTTPTMIWLTAYLIVNSASSSPSSHAGDGRGEQADVDVAGHARDDGRGERADQQLALDGDVDDARALAEHPAERAEDERHREQQRPLQQVDQRGGLALDGPHEEREHDPHAHRTARSATAACAVRRAWRERSTPRSPGTATRQDEARSPWSARRAGEICTESVRQRERERRRQAGRRADPEREQGDHAEHGQGDRDAQHGARRSLDGRRRRPAGAR